MKYTQTVDAFKVKDELENEEFPHWACVAGIRREQPNRFVLRLYPTCTSWQIQLKKGSVFLLEGDWIVKYSDGEIRVFTDAEFQAQFKPST